MVFRLACELKLRNEDRGRADRGRIDAPEGGPPLLKALEKTVAALFLLDRLVGDDGDGPTDQKRRAGGKNKCGGNKREAQE